MKFRFCPNCKTEIVKKKDRYLCPECGMEIFRDSSPTASAVILKENRVLLSTRAIAPKRGHYDIVGGFLNPGEHPADGVLREVKEETGLNINPVHLIGIYVGDYEHQGRRTKTLNFYYIAEIESGKMKPQDDAATLEWFDIDKLPEDKLAFPHHKKVLKDFKRWFEKNR